MPATVPVGTILIKALQPRMLSLGVESEPYSGTWRLVKVLDSFALDRKVRASGWNFFFMAAEVKAMFFGAVGARKL